jgi:prepilin-type processing-associated H-X9-DG protein
MWSMQYHMGIMYPDFIKSPSTLNCPGDPGDETVAERVPETGGWFMRNTDYLFDIASTLMGLNADASWGGCPAGRSWDNYRVHREACTTTWPLLAGLIGEEIPWSLTGLACGSTFAPNINVLRPLKKDAHHANGANLLYGDSHVEWLPLQMTAMYPVAPAGPYHAFEAALGYIPNPFIIGDNCIYEAELTLFGDTYVSWYDGEVLPRKTGCSLIDGSGGSDCLSGWKVEKRYCPPGWYPCT